MHVTALVHDAAYGLVAFPDRTPHYEPVLVRLCSFSSVVARRFLP